MGIHLRYLILYTYLLLHVTNSQQPPTNFLSPPPPPPENSPPPPPPGNSPPPPPPGNSPPPGRWYPVPPGKAPPPPGNSPPPPGRWYAVPPGKAPPPPGRWYPVGPAVARGVAPAPMRRGPPPVRRAEGSVVKPKKNGMNSGEKTGVAFIGIVLALQMCAATFLVIKRRQLFHNSME